MLFYDNGQPIVRDYGAARFLNIEAKAGGPEGLPEFLRRALHATAFGKLDFALGAAQAAGYEEGKRQGWAHANTVFRKALQQAAAELKR